MYNRKDYERFKFLNMKLFIITNLEHGRLHNKTSRYEDRIMIIASVVGGIFILIALATYNTLAELTGLGPVGALILLAVLDLIITYILVLKLHYHIDDKMRERSTSEDGNIKFDLSKEWKIAPGGIRDDAQLNEGRTVTVRYASQAIILRGIMKGTVDCESTDDKKHYAALQHLIDLSMREGYELEMVNLPYNIDNDPLWESESEKIYRSSSLLGPDYTMLMTTLHNHIYDFTAQNSKVTVTYYILKHLGGSSSPEVIASDIQKLSQRCQMDFSGITTKEFKMLLEEYYGINISVEDITSFMTVTSTDIGESRIISYIDKKENLVKISKIFDYQHQLPAVFTTIGFGEAPDLSDLADDQDQEHSQPQDLNASTIYDKDII